MTRLDELEILLEQVERLERFVHMSLRLRKDGTPYAARVQMSVGGKPMLFEDIDGTQAEADSLAVIAAVCRQAQKVREAEPTKVERKRGASIRERRVG